MLVSRLELLNSQSAILKKKKKKKLSICCKDDDERIRLHSIGLKYRNKYRKEII
jgi:hypothetical protein